MPRSCAAASARAICTPYSIALRMGTGPRSDDIGQRFAVDELGHGVRGRAFVAGVVDGDDVGMRQAGERFHLTLESRERLGIGGEGWRQDFDRDVAAQPRVPCAVDLAHPAGTERCDDLVGAEPGARAERHGTL